MKRSTRKGLLKRISTQLCDDLLWRTANGLIIAGSVKHSSHLFSLSRHEHRRTEEDAARLTQKNGIQVIFPSKLKFPFIPHVRILGKYAWQKVCKAPEKCVYFLRFAWSCVSAKLRKGLAKVSNEFHLRLPSLFAPLWVLLPCHSEIKRYQNWNDYRRNDKNESSLRKLIVTLSLLSLLLLHSEINSTTDGVTKWMAFPGCCWNGHFFSILNGWMVLDTELGHSSNRDTFRICSRGLERIRGAIQKGCWDLTRFFAGNNNSRGALEL